MYTVILNGNEISQIHVKKHQNLLMRSSNDCLIKRLNSSSDMISEIQ